MKPVTYRVGTSARRRRIAAPEAIGGVGTIQYQWEFSPTGIAGTYLPLEDGGLIFNSATSSLEVIADALSLA